MKILFPDVTIGCQNEFEIKSIQHNWDDTINNYNVPIDIEIKADKRTLEAIAEFSFYGYNIVPLEEDEVIGATTHRALYARLLNFIVTEYTVCSYK